MTIVNRLGTRPSQAANATARAYLTERRKSQSASSTQDSIRPGFPPVPHVQFENTTLVEYALHKLRWQRLEEAQVPIFISPMAKANLQALNEDLFPLREKVQAFLESERQVMLILGDSGAGKSTFNRYLERQLWNAYQNRDPIPLLINLPAIDRPDKDLIGEHLRTNNFSEAQIQELKQCRQFVLICDGYDESQLTANLHTTNLFNRPGQWNVKMVISCRTQFLGQEYRGRFIPEGSSHYQGQAIDLFQEAVIAPFTREQIEDYVKQYVPLEPRTWTTKDYMDKLKTIPNLMDLVKNPFLLSLSLEALPEVTEGRQDLSVIKVTRVQLYDTFVRHWLAVNNRRLQRTVLTTEDRDMLDQLLEAGFISMGVDYATRLASAIFEHQDGNPVVQYVHVKDKKSWRAQYFGREPEVRLLRESSPLTRNGNQFRFLHRSMLEYFLSCAVFNPSIHEVDDKFCLQPGPDPTPTKRLAADGPLFKRSLLSEPSVIQFLCERVKQHPDFERQLLAVIEQSKIDATAATAAANAITILVRAGSRFNSADLRGIRIPGADLSDGQFDSAQLQGADLTGVNLARSWLRQVDFGDAQMDGVRFEELPYLEEHTTVDAVAFSPNGKLFAACLRNGGLTTYDTTTWTRVHRHREQSLVRSIAFSPNNQHLALGNIHGSCRLWDTVNGQTFLIMEGHTGGVNSVAFSPCGKQIASASYDSTIRLWSSDTGECLFVLNGHQAAVWSAAYSADGRRLVSGSSDGTIRVWDPETGTPEPGWVIFHFGSSRVTLSANGRQFALTAGLGGSEIRLVDAVTGEQGLILRDDIDRLTDIAVSPIGELIVSSSWDNTVRLWDSSNGQLISRMSGHRGRITSCTFSPDGLKIASGDENGIIRLWEVNTSRSSSIALELAAEVRTVVYSPDGLFIISNRLNNTLQLWGYPVGTFRSTPLTFPHNVYSTALSPNGCWFASGRTNGIHLLNAQTDVIERVLRGSTGCPIVDMSFSHCSRWLASCDGDGVTRLWDLESTIDQVKVVDGRVFLNRPNPRGYVVFSPVGDQFAVGSEPGSGIPPRLRLFDARATDFRQPLKEAWITDSLRSMDYSPDGQRLVLGTEASSVLIWDLRSDKPDVILEGHTDEVNSVACSPCGKWIISGSRDKTARLWSGEVDSWSCVAVVSECLDAVTSVAWNPVVPMEFVTGSADGSVRVWQVSSTEVGHLSIRMHWGSHIEQLCATDLTFKGAIGLSPIYRKLLIQRGAIGDS
ncbi:WD40 repeat-like protein [Linnemannia elongata AG-77]|uniref:WD40 repeat-like protein n=1 Tax=Linnemannia elongata AG-77 TaxID=1314771 RepID=A0A197K7I8_9FUNG|nr:WD40 repeat-like protein [Linnemannia elongata AG-77]